MGMGTTAATRLGRSESPNAAGMPAQHGLAEAPDGTLFAVFPDAAPGTLQCLRSTDQGRSFEPVAQSEPLAPVHNASLTVDEAGNLDLVLKAEGGYLFYRKGDQPSPGEVHWSIRVRLYDVPALDSPNAVAFLEEGETVVHAVWSRGEDWNAAYHVPLKVDPERDIWMLERTRIAGPFWVTGHPTPCIELDDEHGLHVAVWAGPDAGIRLYYSKDFGGRWLFDEGRDLAPGPALEGSLSAAMAHNELVVAYGGAPGRLHAVAAGGADHTVEIDAAGPVVRTSAGTGGDGRVHVFFQTEAAGPLLHRALTPGDGAWSETATIHDGPVHSFSTQRQSAGTPSVLLVAGEEPPYDVVVANPAP